MAQPPIHSTNRGKYFNSCSFKLGRPLQFRTTLAQLNCPESVDLPPGAAEGEHVLGGDGAAVAVPGRAPQEAQLQQEGHRDAQRVLLQVKHY